MSGVRVFPHIENAIDIANHKTVCSHSYETPCLAIERRTKELELYGRNHQKNLSHRVENLEVLDRLEWLQERLELWHDVELVRVLVVLHEGPELLQAVELAVVGVPDRLLLEVLVQLRTELALEAVAEVAEQALKAISEI